MVKVYYEIFVIANSFINSMDKRSHTLHHFLNWRI